MKKFVAFMLALMVLSFSVIPCADAMSGMHQEPQYEQVTHDAHNSEDADNCSPFCICSCCAGFSQIAHAPYLTYTEIFHKTSYSLFLIGKAKRIPLPIWQPPQIV